MSGLPPNWLPNWFRALKPVKSLLSAVGAGKRTARSMKSFVVIRNGGLNFVMKVTGVRGRIVLFASQLTGIATRLERGGLSLANFFFE